MTLFFLNLYQSVLIPLLSEWIDECDLCSLDSAFANQKNRQNFLSLLTKCTISGLSICRWNDIEYYDWIIQRGCGMKRVKYSVSDYILQRLTPNIAKVNHFDFIEWDPRFALNNIVSVKHLKMDISSDIVVNGLQSFTGITCLDISGCDSYTTSSFWDLVITTCPLIRTLIVNERMNILPAFKLPELQTVVNCKLMSILQRYDCNSLYYHYGCTVRRTNQSSTSAFCLEDKYFYFSSLAIGVAPSALKSYFDPTQQLLEPVESLDVDGDFANALLTNIVWRNTNNLTYLRVQNVTIADNFVESLPKSCKRLKEIHFGPNVRLSELFVRNVANFCLVMEKFTLPIKYVTEEMLIDLFDKCPLLHRVEWTQTLFECPPVITDAILHHLAVDLLSLRIVGSSCTVCFNGGRDARKLQIYSPNIQGPTDCLRLGQQNPNMTSIDLVELSQFCGLKLSQIVWGCPLLSSIEIENCPLETKSYDHLMSCSQLTSLSLIRQKKITDEFLLAFLESKPNLVKLDLKCSSGFTGQCLQYVANNCPKIRFVNVDRSQVESDDVIALLEGCPRLDRLSLFACNLVDRKILMCLVKKKRMRSLNLTGTNIAESEYEGVLLASGFMCTYMLSCNYEA